MLLDDIARDLVTFTSEVMEGRTVNIMNTAGIIIASTEEERIGSLHQGALDAVRSGKTVSIEPDQVSRFPGAKEGCNMPLVIDGDIVGVIGVYGNPSEILPLARLVEVFAAKYYQLEAMSIPVMAERELKSRLLRNLLYSTEASGRNTQRMLMQELHFEFRSPSLAAVICPVEQTDDPAWASNLSRLLQEKKVISHKDDLWAVDHGRLVILSAGTDFPKMIRESGLLLPEGKYRAAIGDICRDLRSVRHSFEQAVTLLNVTALPFSDISDPENRIRYLFRHMADNEAAFLDPFLQLLESEFTPEELYTLLHSTAVYYHESHAISRAAGILFIHKNTLQYRIRRLESVLNLEHWPDFSKEYFIRLLMERYKSKQGLTTLL